MNLLILSKIFWFIFQPINALLILIFLSWILLFTRFARFARWLVLLTGLAGLTMAHSPLPMLIALPLENRFERPVLPERIDGIISLGGGIDIDVSGTREIVELESAADRITELLVLSRRFPDAKIVYTGGTANLVYEKTYSGSIVPGLLEQMGMEPGRILSENRARNTFENAKLSKQLVEPKAGENWILITSAFHMPRSVGVFRKQGWNVIPWPVDYRTRKTGSETQFFLSAIHHLDIMNLAVKEWIGLAVYYYSGRTSELFPAPDK